MTDETSSDLKLQYFATAISSSYSTSASRFAQLRFIWYRHIKTLLKAALKFAQTTYSLNLNILPVIANMQAYEKRQRSEKHAPSRPNTNSTAKKNVAYFVPYKTIQ